MGKHRKWDDPTPRSRDKCLEAAKEAAAKVFSRLLAEGKINPEDESKEPPLVTVKKEEVSIKTDFIPLPTAAGTTSLSTSVDNQAFSCEIEINDITYACRNLLTKSVTQEDILKVSGAKVATRGRFMSSEERTQATNAGERPLYLSVQGPNQQSVDVAVQRISSIIHSMCSIPLSSLSISSGTTNVRTVMSTASSANSSAPPLAFVQDKLFVGLEHAPPNFDVKQKILGPNGSYLQHIQLETGAKVMLRGKGSGFVEPTSGREAFEPMFIYLQHSNQVGLQQAKQLAQNLLETVQRDYASFQQALALAPPAVNPGTASMLAGLHQPAFPLPNPAAWAASMSVQGFPYSCQAASSVPSFLSNPASMTFQSTSLGTRQSYNGSTAPFASPSRLQMPTGLSAFGGPVLCPAMPPPPPPPPPPPTQISSVSVALSYYEQYLASPACIRSDSPEAADASREHKGTRRRFQEKLEEEEEETKCEGNENDLHDAKSSEQEETFPPSSKIEKDVLKEDAKSTQGPAKDAEGFVLPPPVVNLKRKRPDSDAKDSSLKGSANQPKKVQGALKSVVAYYGSGSEDDDEEEDEVDSK